MNNVNIIGRLGKDPELRYTPAGVAITSFSIAVDEGKDKEGNKRDPSWFDIVVIGDPQASNVAQYCGKGHRVGVSGRLHQNRWTNHEGEKRSKVEIMANYVDFLEPKAADRGTADQRAEHYEQYARGPAEAGEEEGPAEEEAQEDDVFGDQ